MYVECDMFKGGADLKTCSLDEETPRSKRHLMVFIMNPSEMSMGLFDLCHLLHYLRDQFQLTCHVRYEFT